MTIILCKYKKQGSPLGNDTLRVISSSLPIRSLPHNNGDPKNTKTKTLKYHKLSDKVGNGVSSVSLWRQTVHSTTPVVSDRRLSCTQTQLKKFLPSLENSCLDFHFQIKGIFSPSLYKQSAIWCSLRPEAVAYSDLVQIWPHLTRT